MYIIYHCDDIGATPQITKRILEAWKAGLLDSFSITANGDGLKDLIEGLNEYAEKDVRLAVHLNLSEGKALSSSESISLLADPDGNLHYGFIGLLAFWLFGSRSKKRQLLEQVELEWRAQILKAKRICQPRNIKAVDGHMHVHMLPFLFPIAVRLMIEQEIPEIRVSREVFHFSRRFSDSLSVGFFTNLIKFGILKVLSRKCLKIAKKHDLHTNKALVGILYTGRMSRSAALAGIAAACRKGLDTVEIIFHIGRATKEEACRWDGNPSIASFPMNKRRDKEYNELIRLRKDH